jgi:hypothetical protein
MIDIELRLIAAAAFIGLSGTTPAPREPMSETKRPALVTTELSAGDVTFVTDEYGDVRGDMPEQGLFVQGIRVLQRFELVVGGKRPELLEQSGESARSATHDIPGGALTLVRSARVLPSAVELSIRLESAAADVVVSSLSLRLGCAASAIETLVHAGCTHEHAVALGSVRGFETTMRFSAPPAIGPDDLSYPFKLPPHGSWTLGVLIAVAYPR